MPNALNTNDIKTLLFNTIDTPSDCDFVLSEKGTLLYEKEHAYPGKFSMPTKDGRVEFELPETAIVTIAEESQRYLDNGNQCDLPTHHTDNVEASRGKVKKWYTKPDSKGRLGLFSLNEFRDAEAAKLAKTAQTSIHAPGMTEDGAKNNYVRAVTHVALTGRPVIPGLDGFTPIAASLVSGDNSTKESSMPIKELADSIGLQLSEDVIADETKAFGAIADAFKTVKKTSEDLVKEAVLELSEYKKLNPPKADPVKVSRAQVAMMRENRELKLSRLVENGNILPCVRKELEDAFCGEATLTLSLSEDVDDGFDSVVAALKLNDALKLSEVSGPQTKNYSELLNSETNPMMRVAEKAKARMTG